MLKVKEDRIGINDKGNYYFVVEKYFEAFKKAFNKLGSKIIIETTSRGTVNIID